MSSEFNFGSLCGEFPTGFGSMKYSFSNLRFCEIRRDSGFGSPGVGHLQIISEPGLLILNFDYICGQSWGLACGEFVWNSRNWFRKPKFLSQILIFSGSRFLTLWKLTAAFCLAFSTSSGTRDVCFKLDCLGINLEFVVELYYS
jgi:hypothetical protein